MNETNYISTACEQNRLADTASWFLKSGEEAYHADRHVPHPPEGVHFLAACRAGLELFLRWHADRPLVQALGVFSSEPILIIDQEWLDQRPNAPRPHIMMSLAKELIALRSAAGLGETVALMDCPIGDLLKVSLEGISVIKFEPSEERESLGGWQFQFADVAEVK